MMPVGITVEGANILTRTLITFAQGALRRHPYLFTEIEAVQDERPASAASSSSRTAFGEHVAFTLSNAAGALFHNVTFGVFASSPPNAATDAALVERSLRAPRALSRSSPT